MFFSTLLQNINDLEVGGTISHVIDHNLKGKNEPLRSLFFSPYKSKSDFALRAADIIIAPLCFSFITLELAVNSLYLGLQSIVDLARLDTQKAKIHSIDAAFNLVLALISAVVAIVSPLVNLVDFIGSGVTSITQKDEEPKIQFVM